jgi:GNAT superfamily N-acetyltransferase
VPEPELAFTIRPAAEPDAEALAPLLAALGYPVAARAVAERLRRIAAYPGPVVALVADAGDGSLLGVVTAHTFPTVHADAPAAWLTALVVAAEARGRGVGRALVRAAEEWAAAQGAVKVAVTSGAQRADAHRFYEGLGYAYTGRRFARTLSSA